VSTWVFSCPPPTDRHPGPGPAPLSAGGEATPAACARAVRRPRSAVDPRASHPRPTQHHPFPSGPMRADDHAARGPRRPSNPLRQRGRLAAPSHSRVQRGPDSAAAEPRTPEARPSGHLDGTGRVTPDVRLTDWTDVRTADRRTRTGRRPAWPASGHPRDRRPLAGRPDLARVAASEGAWPPMMAPR
jgi:hypothetical protein